MSFVISRALRFSQFKGVAAQLILRKLNTHISNPQLKPHFIATQINWIYKQNDGLKIPNQSIGPIKLPTNVLWIPKEEPQQVMEIEAPASGITYEKEAARLIVIRRKKMKKHKLRKLRKRMKYENAKIRQRRELKKEKDFQAILIKQCKEADIFSAENYVDERLGKLHEIIVPKFWKGRRMPEFLIREKMGLPPKN